MPHAIIEYSGNIEEEVLCADLTNIVHGTMINSGLFSPNDIKTRSYDTSDFMVGEKGQDGSFIHITIFLMEGRTAEQKQKLSQDIRDNIPAIEADSLTVDVREISKDIYRKRKIGA